jgi:sodium-dependent dicarboxylate transporter 2/3/5
MVFALPLSLLLLIVVLIVLEIRYPSHGLQVRGLAQAMKEALKALGPLRSSEKLLGWIFALTIVCWIVPGFVLGIFPEIEGVRTLNERLSLSAVGLFSGLLLFVLPLGGANKLLDWADARSVDWGTLMLFGGGLALGEMIEKTGLASLLGSFVFGGFVAQPVLLVVAVVILSLLFSEFASNTASAAVIIPMLIGISGGSTDSLQWLVIAATCGASLGFMLPVSTPPNAIVYSSGRVSAREMLTSGVWLDVIGALVVILFVTGLLYNL